MQNNKQKDNYVMQIIPMLIINSKKYTQGEISVYKGKLTIKTRDTLIKLVKQALSKYEDVDIWIDEVNTLFFSLDKTLSREQEVKLTKRVEKYVKNRLEPDSKVLLYHIELEIPNDESDSVIGPKISKLKTYKDLLLYNKTWLNDLTYTNVIANHGSAKKTSGEYLNVDIDSILYNLPELIEMNELGFLTVDSQSGIKEKNHLERAYITGYMLNKQAEHVWEELNRLGYIVMRIKMSTYIEYGPDILSLSRIPVTIDDNKIYTQVGLATDIDWIKELQTKLSERILSKYSLITIIDPVYGRLAGKRDGIFTKIIKSLTKYIEIL